MGYKFSNPELEVYKCPVKGCTRQYQVFGWLKNHAAQHHNMELFSRDFERETNELKVLVVEHRTKPALKTTMARQSIDLEQDERKGEEEEVEKEDAEGVNEEEEEEEKVYCYCREIYVPNRAMIGCDGCDEWFHASCLGMTEAQMNTIETFFCLECRDRDRYLSIRYKGEPKRPCANAQCGQHAGENSKYCSHKCGLVRALVLARATIRYSSVIQGLSESSSVKCDAVNDHSDLKRIEEVAVLKKQKLRATEALTTLELNISQEQEQSDTLTAVTCPSEKQVFIRGDSADCPVCGQSLAVNRYTRHVHTCSLKAEELQVPESIYSSLEYAALKGEFCRDNGRHYTDCTHPALACPLHSTHRKPRSAREVICGYTGVDGDSPPCQIVKCTRHYGWDINRRFHIAREIFIKKAELIALEDEETRLKMSIGARHNPFNSLFHRTLDHDQFVVTNATAPLINTTTTAPVTPVVSVEVTEIAVESASSNVEEVVIS